MRLRHLSLFAFGLLSVTAFAIAPTRSGGDDVAKLIALGKSDNHVMEHLDHLANRIGPRLTGSDNLTNACEWARAEFESFGLSNCRLEKWGEFPVGFNRGPSSGHMIAPEVKELHFATNAWTAGTKGPTSGLTVIAPTNDAELDGVRSKLKGAWVLTPPAPPRASPARPTPPAADAGAAPAGAGTGAKPKEPGTVTVAVGSETAAIKTVDAAATNAGATAPGAGSDGSRTRGAASAAPSAPTNSAADRAFRTKLDKVYAEEGIAGTIRCGRGDLLITGGSSRVTFDKLPTRPSITLLAAEGKEIADRLKAGEEVRLEFDIRNWFKKGPIDLFNVIAEIPGSEKPDEFVVVGGHIDSWDGASGAQDNGTGCSTTLEAARLIMKSGVKPKRTIRFMLWSGEEQGLLGSAAYVKKHKDEMEKISGVLVHDEGTNYCAALPTTAAMKPQLESVFAPIVDLDPEMPFKLHEVKGITGGGSDFSSFLSANVPGLFWEQKGRTSYTHIHHTQYDTYETAVPEYQKNSSIVIATGALGIANLPEMLSRVDLRPKGGAGGGFGGRRLGVQLAEDMTIEEVTEEGLAEKVGLKTGDKIVKIGDKAVADQDEMRTLFREGPAKTKVVVMRAGKEMEFPLEFPPDTGAGGFGRRLGLRFAEGAKIDEVTAEGIGEKAGLKVGDQLVKIGDTKVAALGDLFRAFNDAGDAPKIVVMRDGQEVVVTLTMPERP